MPKRAHGRPAKSKNRTRRTPPQPRSNGLGAAPVLEQELVPRGGVTATAPRTTTSPGPATSALRRNPNLLRKTPAVTINYEYLHRDINRLALLAPAMIVLLVIAYFFLH